MGKIIIRSTTVSQSLGFFTPTNKALEERGYEVVLLSSPGKEMIEFREEGFRAIEVEMERHISLSKDVRSLMNLIKVFRKEKPYLVHSMTPKAGMLCMLAAWLTQVPRRVHTFTGLIWPTATGMKRRLLMTSDWLTCLCATHVIPEGQGVMNDLQQHITNKQMRVLGLGNVRGVDMIRFSKRPKVVEKAKLIKKDGAFTFIFVGRIVGDKGINELVEAFVKLSKEMEKPRLLLVGNYEEKLDTLKPITLENIRENTRIEAVGPQYGDDLLAYYAASNCFVFPSYREGFPNTVMEAGAMELPSIVTDINGSREIVENGKNGVIIPPKDTGALYDAMKKMIEAKDEYNTMAANARSMIESRFEQGYVRKCLLEFYDEIL